MLKEKNFKEHQHYFLAPEGNLSMVSEKKLDISLKN